ncbi:hypothetical protein [Promicromonospora sp. NFX87]|uniref:hypothetical protein n=1 Tax=Promicromonospora sp. NFX87 TaxID=3402691 RepID=UPI003AFA3515
MAAEDESQNTVQYAVQHGDRRAVLVAMRDVVSVRIDDKATSSRDIAALTNRLMSITAAIEKIDAEVQEGAEDGDLDPEEDFDPDEDV